MIPQRATVFNNHSFLLLQMRVTEITGDFSTENSTNKREIPGKIQRDFDRKKSRIYLVYWVQPCGANLRNVTWSGNLFQNWTPPSLYDIFFQKCCHDTPIAHKMKLLTLLKLYLCPVSGAISIVSQRDRQHKVFHYWTHIIPYPTENLFIRLFQLHFMFQN